jgi:hypothetical protein
MPARFSRELLAASLLSFSASATDYYLSARGNDSGPGTQDRPWATLALVNRADLRPGDRILLEGGQTFAGTLELNDRGKTIVTSYGTGIATIDGGNGSAIRIEGSDHLAVRNLRLRGAGRKAGNKASGLVIARSKDVELDRIEVFGFRGSGVDIDGVENGRITRIHAHENGFAGINSGGATSRNLYVGYCLAENNPGDPTVRANHSGNGIVIGHVRDAVIEYSEARYNGWDMPWTGNGPVGIWTWESDRVTIQFCVSHHNRSTALDGGGFDFDGGVTNSVLQYNYSHDNFGTGYLICQYDGAGKFAGNIVRYNISQDDGLKDHDAGILVWIGGPGMKDTAVYNNTVFNAKGSAVAFGVAESYSGEMPEFRFHNNIFVSRGPQIRGGSNKGKFIGNLYWSVGERGFDVDGHKDFNSWVAATGQEKFEGRLVGRFADPLLKKDGPGLLTDPDVLPSLHEYQLLPGSPAIAGGIHLQAAFGIDPGKRDFYGNAVPAGKTPSVGAHEPASRP